MNLELTRPLAIACALMLGATAASAQVTRGKRVTTQQPALAKASQPAAAPVTRRYEKDDQPHPGKAYRVDKMRPGKWGDTRVLESVAGHAVIYAKQRYGISDIVSDADYQRASKEMYDYLSWKYGNPSLVAAQWITAGYQHFDNFAAEAAAALMGTELPGPAGHIALPKEVTTWLKAQVDSLKKDPNYNPCIEIKQASPGPRSGQAGNTQAAQNAGQDPAKEPQSSDPVTMLVGAACDVMIRMAADAAKQAIERIGISDQAFNMKRNFNIGDRSAEFMIALKRNPTLSLSAAFRPVQIIAVGEGGAQ